MMQAYLPLEDSPLKDRDAAAFLLSLTLHVICLLFLTLPKRDIASITEHPVTVKLIAPPQDAPRETKQNEQQPPNEAALRLPEKQIVSPSDSPEAEPKKPTRFLSDKSSAAQREQIRRGDGASAEDKKQLSAVLRLDEKQLQQTIRPSDDGASAPPPEASRSAALREYRPFSGNAGSLFSRTPGINDYLPDIPDGEITLLNAKADQHAVFVRRVANQVFAALRRLNWQQLPAHEVQQISRFATVRATMSKAGKLLSAELLETSGSAAFDAVVLAAARQGSWDQNPPAGALSNDGLLHFVFKGRSWTRRAGDGAQEQRWLLLATGLQ